MSNIAIFKTGKIPQYLTSVNTPDFVTDPDVLIDPDITLVANTPIEFWKREGDSIVEMSPIEKTNFLDARLEERREMVNDLGYKDLKVVLTALIKVINLRLPAGNKITKDELITAIKKEIL